jgi:hypothetical protein
VEIHRENGNDENLFAPLPLPQFKRGKSEEDIAGISGVSHRFFGID